MPTGDANGARETSGALADAPVTFAIILANLAIFAGEVIASRSLSSLGDVPDHVRLAFGANAPLTIALGQYDRLVASCFLHADLLHVALNMWALGQIGEYAEETVGSARYSVLYVVTGVAGSMASLLWGLWGSGRVPVSVGASGAVCGVMGAALVLGVRLEGWRSGIARQVAFWLVVVLAYGALAPKIDNAAHVGGLVAGCASAVLWRRGIHYSRRATFLSIGVSAAVCVASGGAVLWRDMTDPFALDGPNERSDKVESALLRHDCVEARRALAATTRALSRPTPELAGLRAAVDRQCPPGTK